MNDNLISIHDRAAMQQASEREPTLQELAGPSGTVIDRGPEDLVSEFENVPEEVEEIAGTLEERYIAAPVTPHLQLCKDVAECTNSAVLDINLQPRIEVVIGVFEDEAHATVDTNSVGVINGSAYNLIQPLGSYSKKSNRVGVAYAAIPNAMKAIAEASLENCRIILGRDTATLAIQTIVNTQLQRVTDALYREFPIYEADSGELIPYLILEKGDADNLVEGVTLQDREGNVLLDIRALISHEAIVRYHESVIGSDGVDRQLVELIHVLHLRVPIFLRVESSRIESTLRAYVNNLKASALELGFDANVWLAVPNHSLFNEATWNLMQIVRENCPEAQPVTFATFSHDLQTNAEEVVSTISQVSVHCDAEAVFRAGDFIIPLSLIEESEGEE